MPLREHAAPTATSRRRETKDDRDSFGARVDYQISAEARGARPLPADHRPTPRRRRSRAAIGNTAKRRCSDYMGSHTFIVTPHAINVARVSYNRIDAKPAVTSGLTNEDYGINVPEHQRRWRQGLASIVDHRVLRPRRRAAAVREARQRGLPVHRRLHLDARQRTSLKFGVDMRREHMVIAFINRPNGDFTFTRRACSGNARRGLPARPAGAVPPDDDQPGAGRHRLSLLPATRRTSGAPRRT